MNGRPSRPARCRAFISLAQTDAASRYILLVATHGAPPATINDAYSTFSSAAICAEVAKLNLARRGAGEVLATRKAVIVVRHANHHGAENGNGADAVHQRRRTAKS